MLDVMLAARLHSPGDPLKIEDCPLPALEPGEALVRVSACGVCGSDLHMCRGAVPVRKTPIVLGSFGSTRADLDRVIELVKSGTLDLSGSISARLPLEEASKALEVLESKEGDPVRLVILPWEGA